MAITECRECKQNVSDQALSCPHCGAPYPAALRWTGPGIDREYGPRILGYPLVHISFGRDARGKLRVARGVIAIGQFGIGLITIAQFGFGLVFGLGQFILAPLAIAQIAGGYVTVGQLVIGYYGLAQIGFAEHLWSMNRTDPEAVRFFKDLLDTLLRR